MGINPVWGQVKFIPHYTPLRFHPYVNKFSANLQHGHVAQHTGQRLRGRGAPAARAAVGGTTATAAAAPAAAGPTTTTVAGQLGHVLGEGGLGGQGLGALVDSSLGS